jgi:AcrR family transcriptional regulator
MLTRRAAVALRPGRRPGTLRAAILRAARRLHAAHGVEGITARALAQAVGVSPTALYLHFRSLEDVFEQLRMEGHERLAGYLKAAGGDTALARIRAMGRAYFRFGVEHGGDFDLMFHGRPGAARRRDAVHREMFTLLILRDAVVAGIAAGELRNDLDPMVVTNALWATVHGVTALRAAGLLVETSDGHADEVLDAVLDGALRWIVPAGRARRR